MYLQHNLYDALLMSVNAIRPDHSSRYSKVASFQIEIDNIENLKSMGDEHFVRLEDGNLVVYSCLNGTTRTLRPGVVVDSFGYAGSHHLYASDSSGTIKIWNMSTGEPIAASITTGEVPEYVVSSTLLYTKDASGKFWRYDGGTRSAYTPDGNPFIFTAEEYGQGVWYLSNGYLCWWNAVSGVTSRYAQLYTSGTYSILPTDSYLVVVGSGMAAWVAKKTAPLTAKQVTLPAAGDSMLAMQGDKLYYYEHDTQNRYTAQINSNLTLTKVADETVLSWCLYQEIDLTTGAVIQKSMDFDPNHIKEPQILGTGDSGELYMLTQGNIVKYTKGVAVTLGAIDLPTEVDGNIQSSTVDSDYMYMLVQGAYTSILLRYSLATLECKYIKLPVSVSRFTIENIYSNALRVTDSHIWICTGGIPYSGQIDNILVTRDEAVVLRMDKKSVVWDNSVTQNRIHVWTTGIDAYGKLVLCGMALGDEGVFIATTLGAEGYLVMAGDSDSPVDYDAVTYMGQASKEVLPPFQPSDSPFMSNKSAVVADGGNVVANLQHIDAATMTANNSLAWYNDKSETTPAGREVYETGVGFKSVFYDKLSGHYRYYMDTGACIEFDEDGNLISKGQKGAPGRDGLPGTKGEQGKGIQSTIPHYLASSQSSGVTYATEGWTSTPQDTTNIKRYLWTYTTTTYTDGESVDSNPIIIGTRGDKGDNGAGLSGLNTKKYTKPDNAGKACWLVTHDITDLFTVTTPTSGSMTTRGFSGIIISSRENHGYNQYSYQYAKLFMTATYRPLPGCIHLWSSNPIYTPYVIQSDGKYYLAIKVYNSGRDLYLFGRHSDGRQYNASTGTYSGDTSYIGTWLPEVEDGSLPDGYTIVGDYESKKWNLEGYAFQTEVDGKAPTFHASTEAKYGAGSSVNYGHVKLSDSLTWTVGPAGGVAATPSAVKLTNDKIGDLTSLATTAKGNLVAAINEVRSNTRGRALTMQSLGFTGGQDSVVQLADFLAALQSKMGGGGIALITWQNASSAKVTDGTTTISINGGHLVWGSTNAFPTSTWSTVTATYYPATDGSAWKMSATVSGTAGTVTYKKIIALHAPAINHVYIQFRGQSAPTTLYPGTSWQNISSTYAGRFFRAEGGDAAAFGSQQAGGLPNITGDTDYGENPSIISPTGAFYKIGSSYLGSSGSDYNNASVMFDASRSNSLYGAASEVRPINETFRIWKRIS